MAIAQSRQPCYQDGDEGSSMPPGVSVAFLDEPEGIWKVVLTAPDGYHFTDLTSGVKVLYYYEDNGFLISILMTSEPDYARAEAETTLQGLSEADLEKYTRYGNAEFKNATDQETLDAISDQFYEHLGGFKSIVYLYAVKEDGHIIVHYKANYAEGVVRVEVDFDANHRIAHRWTY